MLGKLVTAIRRSDGDTSTTRGQDARDLADTMSRVLRAHQPRGAPWTSGQRGTFLFHGVVNSIVYKHKAYAVVQAQAVRPGASIDIPVSTLATVSIQNYRVYILKPANVPPVGGFVTFRFAGVSNFTVQFVDNCAVTSDTSKTPIYVAVGQPNLFFGRLIGATKLTSLQLNSDGTYTVLSTSTTVGSLTVYGEYYVTLYHQQQIANDHPDFALHTSIATATQPLLAPGFVLPSSLAIQLQQGHEGLIFQSGVWM